MKRALKWIILKLLEFYRHYRLTGGNSIASRREDRCWPKNIRRWFENKNQPTKNQQTTISLAALYSQMLLFLLCCSIKYSEKVLKCFLPLFIYFFSHYPVPWNKTTEIFGHENHLLITVYDLSLTSSEVAKLEEDQALPP